ncbi:MAG: PAS domain-containing protein [Treponema sp.]|jgi:two-component system phosphate regulon sensor histidine kinase PhoR|nr:PAS domain-containing protein [Treponema sp.]
MTVFKKTMLNLSFAVFGFSVVLVILAFAFMNSLYYEIKAVGLSNTAKTLMAAIGEDRITEIFTTNKNAPAPDISLPVSAAGAYRLTLIDPAGNVLWDSHVAGGHVNHIDREEITSALEGREGSIRRYSISTGTERIYCALPVFDKENKTIGVFRLSFAIPGFGVRVSSIILPFFIFAFILAAAAFCAIFAFSRSLSISFSRLVKIAQTGASLLSDPDAMEDDVVDFTGLEKALRAITGELNYRFEQARAEGCRLEAILNGMSEAVFAMDSNLVLHLVNPRARELFNLGQRDIHSLSLLEATHSTELEEAAKKALTGGKPLEIELTFHTGAEQYFQVFAAPLGASQPVGLNNGVVLVLQEITRLVKLERIRKDFVANVSHELRTPIQLIKGFSETVLDSLADANQRFDDSEAKEKIFHYMEIIRKNVDNMENLTNDLLVLAGLENDGSNIHNSKKQKLFSLLAEAVSLVELQAKRKQTEITINCPEDLEAKLYGSLIIQAMINLIDNGIKYSSQKSKIWVNARIENEELTLEVLDKGMGISSEHLERIFERFYRVDRARSREAGGTGLGLSIVRHIALLHGGKAEVESHAGEGSVFRIRIPHPQN